MFKMINNIFTNKRILFLVLTALLLPVRSVAQCAMCRAALQGSENSLQAEAVNDGIVYLMVIPYLLVGVIGIVIYKSRKQARQGK